MALLDGTIHLNLLRQERRNGNIMDNKKMDNEKLERARHELEYIQGFGYVKYSNIAGHPPLPERVFPRTTNHWDDMDVLEKWEYCNEYSKRYLNSYYIFSLELKIHKAIPENKRYDSHGNLKFIHYHNDEPTVDLYDELFNKKN